MKENLKNIGLVFIVIGIMFGLSACGNNETDENDGFIVVATTTVIADLAREIGGENIEVIALMGPGIDPHGYNASAGDVNSMSDADLVIHNGLHLEGKMGEIFENLEVRNKVVVEMAEGLSEENLVTDESTGAHDPHIWYNILLWSEASENLLNGLIEMDPDNEALYRANYEAYKVELTELDAAVREQVALVPEESRVLITAHDAFAYFGEAYGFEVRGLQGISTETEAGTADVSALANYIVEKQIKAIFVESSVPRKNIEALQEAVIAGGFNVEIGGELYSDSLGSAGTDEETYIGTVASNVETIVNALK